VLYHLRAPGDPAPEGLDLLIPPDVVRDGVSAERAAQGVEFGFAYTNPRNYDRIDFLLGDITVPFEVVDASTPVAKTLFTDTFLQAGDNATTLIQYRVTDQLGNANQSPTKRLDIHLGRPLELLPPTIDEALGDQLDPADTPNGATVRIPAEVNLLGGDSGEVRWAGLPGAGSINVPFTVSASEAGQDKTVPVPKSVVEANVDQTITLEYTLRRQGGSPLPSSPAVYDIRRQVGSGQLLVMGARSVFFKHWVTSEIRQLTALDKTTRKPCEALWQYEGDSESVSASHFPDTQPSKLLHVRSGNDGVRINPVNVFSNGNNVYTDHAAPYAAFVARRDSGHLVGWGMAVYGGDIPSTIRTFTDIVEVAGSAFSFTALRANGHVVAWGSLVHGGEVPESIARLKDIDAVYANSYGFAARRTNGRLVAWGDERFGGTLPGPIEALADIDEVTGGHWAFAARRTNGQVVAWGHPETGGTVPNAPQYNDVKRIIGSAAAFAALRTDGSVVAWGHASGGGEVPRDIATLDDIVDVSATHVDANADRDQGAFAARRANGHVVAWGHPSLGGSVPQDIADLNDILQLTSSSGAFAALQADGHVVAWGHPEYGAAVPGPILTLDNIVQLTSTQGAFAALLADGTVVAWGLTAWGGDTRAVADQLFDVRAVYANNQAFTALTNDGRVVTWGLADAGGNSDAVQNQLRGQVSYYATPASRGTALTLLARSQESRSS
jgi:alpha-tubulin suppressor-like RCC1 family protein